ncbi:MAG: hypothetical protein KatS3mg087_1082 [Patescibacteria group bacterium]|nr:MAG: hypothetical protein KatS3mg087_1082 [Patescibacteria group bacterium]
MADVLEAPVVGVKILKLANDGRRLRSAAVNADWPFSPRGYRSARGFFFWSFPPAWLPLVRPMHADEVIAIVRVLPADTPCLSSVEPVGNPTWPRYMDDLPLDADAMCARNMVAVARAVAIDCIVLHPQHYAVLDAIDRYAPVVVPKTFADRPITVSPAAWSITDHMTVSVWSEYETASVTRYRDGHGWWPCQLWWEHRETRNTVMRAVDDALRGIEHNRRLWREFDE